MSLEVVQLCVPYVFPILRKPGVKKERVGWGEDSITNQRRLWKWEEVHHLQAWAPLWIGLCSFLGSLLLTP